MVRQRTKYAPKLPPCTDKSLLGRPSCPTHPISGRLPLELSRRPTLWRHHRRFLWVLAYPRHPASMLSDSRPLLTQVSTLSSRLQTSKPSTKPSRQCPSHTLTLETACHYR